MHARLVGLHAKRLVGLQREIERKAAEIAGRATNWHEVGYDEYDSMARQRAVDDGAVRGPGLVDVVALACGIAAYAASVAGEAVPPPLPSE